MSRYPWRLTIQLNLKLLSQQRPVNKGSNSFSIWMEYIASSVTSFVSWSRRSRPVQCALRIHGCRISFRKRQRTKMWSFGTGVPRRIEAAIRSCLLFRWFRRVTQATSNAIENNEARCKMFEKSNAQFWSNTSDTPTHQDVWDQTPTLQHYYMYHQLNGAAACANFRTTLPETPKVGSLFPVFVREGLMQKVLMQGQAVMHTTLCLWWRLLVSYES